MHHSQFPLHLSINNNILVYITGIISQNRPFLQRIVPKIPYMTGSLSFLQPGFWNTGWSAANGIPESRLFQNRGDLSYKN